jgi:hypothetical protein
MVLRLIDHIHEIDSSWLFGELVGRRDSFAGRDFTRCRGVDFAVDVLGLCGRHRFGMRRD